MKICTVCKNNLCLINPEVFAEKHLSRKDRAEYLALKERIDELLRKRIYAWRYVEDGY